MKAILVLILQFLCLQDVCGQFNPIAFTLGQDSHLTLYNATTIPFPVVISNNQNAVVQSGVFTCSEAGLYKFQLYSLTRSNTKLFLELLRNDAVVATVWGYTSGDYAAAGNAVILRLEVGDTVRVQSRDQYDVELYGTSDEIYTTFTGVQLGSNSFEGPSNVEAFSVTLNQHLNVSTGTSVQYNHILVDTNNGYDPSTGIYTAKSSGMFLIHLFSLARQGQEVYQELYHNNHYVMTIYGIATDAYCDDGNSVILHLKQNDQIRVNAHRFNELLGTSTQIYSTLSGVMLFNEEVFHSNELPVAAFSVGLSKYMNVSNGEKVVFDRIFTDLHHAYDHITGEYIAPASGVYEFNFHALGQKDAKVWLELYHNYKYVDSLYDHTPGGYAAAGNAAVVEMDAGDVVYVVSHNESPLHGTGHEIYCTFSGYMLFAHSNDVGVIGR